MGRYQVIKCPLVESHHLAKDLSSVMVGCSRWRERLLGLCHLRLTRVREIRQVTFFLHLKEYEFRFNDRNQNLYKIMLKIVRLTPLFSS